MADPAPGRPLAGRGIVVTGASSGIGLATARSLAAAGAFVHGLSRRGGENCTGLTSHACDVSRSDEVERVMEHITAQADIDGVVLAAGTNVPGRSLDQLTVSDWHQLIDVNLSGAFHVLHACLPQLRRRGGDAVLVSSVSALWPDASGAAYQASKAGVVGLARAAALEEHHHGVRVTAVLPGMVDTPLLGRRPQPPDAAHRAAALQPEDVASVCLFVLSLPAHAYIPEITVLPVALQAIGDT